MAYLTRGASNVHGGAFDTLKYVQRKYAGRFPVLDLMLSKQHGPALNAGLSTGQLELVLIHDLEEFRLKESYEGVALHYQEPSALLDQHPGNDRRWAQFGDYLRQRVPMSRSCVFIVDIGDVYPTTPYLSELCRANPDALLLASDTCRTGGAWGWLNWVRRESHFQASATFDRWLSKPARMMMIKQSRKTKNSSVEPP